MSKPIILWTADKRLTTDDAGTSVVKSVLPPVPPPGPYEEFSGRFPRLSRNYIPPLSYFCLRQLALYPEHIHHLAESQRIPYVRPTKQDDYDPIRALVPGGYRAERENFDWSLVDPRLWAVIAQAFYDLPDNFYRYRIPLSDKHIPLLQRIPWSGHFSLIVVLDLAECLEMSDDSITSLKELPNLAALDISETPITSNGIGRLARSLDRSTDSEGTVTQTRGPWQLRILRLYGCERVTNDVMPHLQEFRLLSTIDLRGTSCKVKGLTQMKDFCPCPFSSLLFPIDLANSLQVLQTIQSTSQNKAETAEPPRLFSSQRPFVLLVDKLHHPKLQNREATIRPNVIKEDSFAVFSKFKPDTSTIDPYPAPFPKKKPDQRKQAVQMGEAQQVYRTFAFEDDRTRENEKLRDARDQLRNESANFDTEYDDIFGGSAPCSSSDAGSRHEDDSESEEEGASLPLLAHGRHIGQSAATFYANRGRPKSPPKTRISAKEPVKDLENPDPLALFRPPLPWALPKGTAIPPSRSLFRQPTDARKRFSSNNTTPQLEVSAEAAQSINRDLTNLINKRRRTTKHDSVDNASNLPSGFAPSPSRNPFLRKPSVPETPRSVSSTVSQFSTEKKSLPTSTKSLRPLSTLPIPLPPSPPHAEILPTRRPEKSMTQKREELRNNFSICGEPHKDKRLASTAAGDVSLPDSTDRKSIKKKKSMNQDFDWEGWSKKV